MRKQMRALTSLIVMSVVAFSYVGCTGANRVNDDYYCMSGRNDCKCNKPKPPFFNPSNAPGAIPNSPVCMPVSSQANEMTLATHVAEYSHKAGEPGIRTTVVKSAESSKTIVEPGLTKSMSTSEYSKTVNESSHKATSSHPGVSHAASDASSALASHTSQSPQLAKDAAHATTAHAANHVAQTNAHTVNHASQTTAQVEHHADQAASHVANYVPKAASPALQNASHEQATTKAHVSNAANVRPASETNPVKATHASTHAKANDQVATRVVHANQTRHWNETHANSVAANNGANYSSSSNVAPAKGCTHAPHCEMATGVTLKAKNPKMCMLGIQYAIDYELIATADVHDVVLTATLPEGTTYVNSQPEAKVSGHQLTWKVDRMNRGQNALGKINLKADKEGELSTTFNVTAAADGCCSIMCARPQLTSEKTGPEEVSIGDQVAYVVTVANTGNYPAEDVVLVIRDAVQTNADPYTARLGTIDINQAKKVNYSVLASKRGQLAYKATATSSNANQTAVDLNTLVTGCSVDCLKKGPKEAYIGQTADYQITVQNSGDRTLHDIVVTDNAHAATNIVKAKDATVTDRKAVWKLKELKAGEKANFNVTLTSRSTGNYTNSTLVTNKEGFNATRDTTTHWKGHAALDVSMSTSENSIFVGENTRYKITVTNQGQEPDSNVKVTIDFPAGLEPISSSGDSSGKIDGQTVTFAPVNLALRQTLEYYVTVKANATGDLRPKVHVSSDAIKSPVTQEESLIVN